MVVLRNGKQVVETAARGPSEGTHETPAVPESNAVKSEKSLRDQKSKPAKTEKVDLGTKSSKEAEAGQPRVGNGGDHRQHAPSKSKVQDGAEPKKQRRNGGRILDQGDSSTHKPSKAESKAEGCNGSSEQHDTKQPTKKDTKKDIKKETKKDTKKSTRKDLEIEWDRSQLRDPRPTPERVLLPRKSDFDLTEEEKETFKGRPPKRPKHTGRLNASDKNEMLRAEAKNNIAHSFRELYLYYEAGPKGSPTYDEAGFQLDYQKVADWMKPKAYNKRSMVKGMEKTIEREMKDESKMAAAFFEGGKAPGSDSGPLTFDLLKDKVSKDLGIAWHKVTPAKVEEWASRGFAKENLQDYVRSTVTKEEQRRFTKMHAGSSLRK